MAKLKNKEIPVTWTEKVVYYGALIYAIAISIMFVVLLCSNIYKLISKGVAL